MAKVAFAKKKWVERTGPPASKKYCEGVAAFLGVPTCLEIRARRWGEQTGRMDVADRWETGYRAAMAP